MRNLTNHPDRPADLPPLPTFPLSFDEPAALERALAGADCLVNTYWVRFPQGDVTFEGAVRNIDRLVAAARRAGVGRILHVSVARADESELPYYRGKAAAEDVVRGSGVPAAIVRPTVLFGDGDVLINNIAWVLRHVPIFGIPGDGRYPIQPVHVRDHAALIAGLVVNDDRGTHDSQGPERYSFKELVRLVRWAIGSRAAVMRMPAAAALLGARAIGVLRSDVILTADEMRGLMDGLLASDAPPSGATSLAQWLRLNRTEVGRRYASELERHYRLGRHRRR